MAGSAALINTYRNQPYAHIYVCKNCSSPPVNIASSITASAVSVTSTEPAIIRGGPTRAVGRAALYMRRRSTCKMLLLRNILFVRLYSYLST